MKKTSQEWQELYPEIKVLDPDGWDRTNFQYSWYKEKIILILFIILGLNSCYDAQYWDRNDIRREIKGTVLSITRDDNFIKRDKYSILIKENDHIIEIYSNTNGHEFFSILSKGDDVIIRVVLVPIENINHISDNFISLISSFHLEFLLCNNVILYQTDHFKN